MFSLEYAIASWRHQFKHSRVVTDKDVTEMERHLRDHIADLMEDGLEPDAAFSVATREMGGLSDSESEFSKVRWKRVHHDKSFAMELAAWRAMATNYLKVATRTMLRNPVPTTINIMGMAIALSCCVLVFFFLTSWHSMDSYHLDGDRIFLAQHEIMKSQNREIWGRMPAPIGPALKRDFPQIENTVRVNYYGVTVQHDDRVFEEGIMFVDDGFFDMLTFPLRLGSPDALADQQSAIISDRTAKKFFSDSNPIGETLSLVANNQTKFDVTVAGVAEPFPSNTGFRFDFLMGFERMSEFGLLDTEDWGNMISGLFIKVTEPAVIPTIEAGMNAYIGVQNAARPDWQISGFTFDNFTQPSSEAYLVRGRVAEAAHPALSIMFIVMAVFMLSLSCFNYINISLSSATRRFKEIGLRKVIGGSRVQLALQFMTENVVLCLVALILGIVICYLFLVPLFNSLFILQLEFSIAGRYDFWLFIVVLVVFVGIISGLYPSVYVASFRPTIILYGKQKLADNAWFTNAFLGFQFVLAFITVIFSVLLTMNSRYLVQQDWGYDPADILVVDLQESNQYSLLARATSQIPTVTGVAGANAHIGRTINISKNVFSDGNEVSLLRYDVSPGYPKAMKLRLDEGRFFREESTLDLGTSTIINQSLARSLGWDAPIGKNLEIDSTAYTVIGVVEDFTFFLLAEPLPAMFIASPDIEDYNFLIANTSVGRLAATEDAVQQAFAELFPSGVYRGLQQVEIFDTMYRQYNSVVNAFNYLSGLALLIACMGLFGLVAQNIARRMKEISIRKVVGASLTRLAITVNRRYLQLLGISAVIATTISLIAVSLILTVVRGMVPVAHMPITPLPFSIAYILVLSTAIVAIGLHLFKIARANPADTLRSD